MMPKTKRWIVLHAERVGQIEQLAKLRKATIAGAVKSLVADRVTAGELPAGFPGCAIEYRDAHALIELDGVRLSPIPVADAAQFAADLAQLAAQTAGRAVATLSDGTEFVARFTGRGVRLAASGASYGVSVPMLREIAGQLGEAAR